MAPDVQDSYEKAFELASEVDTPPKKSNRKAILMGIAVPIVIILAILYYTDPKFIFAAITLGKHILSNMTAAVSSASH